MKERKRHKSEKVVKPVKKSLALFLTIVTVFAFAAACFSLGFCSGKKVNEAYAAITELATYTIKKGAYKGINTPIFSGPNINQTMTFQANNITYQQLRIRPAKQTIVYWDEALGREYMAYDGGWRDNSADIYLFEDAPCSSSFYKWFYANFENKEIEYTLTCEYEGAQNYSITYGMTGEITRNGNVFTGKPGASAYVRITPKDGYIMRNLSYQITAGSVASITPGSSNNYTIVLAPSNATILFSVVATAATVDISSGYYWMQCRYYGTDFSELTLQSGQFQIVETISSSGIVWQDLTGLVCGAGKLSFRLPGDKRISVYTVSDTHDDFSLSSGVVISDQGNIVEGLDYDYYSTLWAANWYPVIYVPSNIMEGEAPDSLVSFFKSSSVYKADPVYYSGFYLTSKSTVNTVDPLYDTYLSAYVPSSNAFVFPSSVSFIPDSGGVSNITYKSALNFMGDVSSDEYVIYCGYDYNYNSTVSYNRVGRIPPASRGGTYMESIYICPTIMPEQLYNLMASWFDITSGPVVPDSPPSSYWDGLDEILSYEIFGIPLSSLFAIVVSSVFVVVVIRLFAGG